MDNRWMGTTTRNELVSDPTTSSKGKGLDKSIAEPSPVTSAVSPHPEALVEQIRRVWERWEVTHHTFEVGVR